MRPPQGARAHLAILIAAVLAAACAAPSPTEDPAASPAAAPTFALPSSDEAHGGAVAATSWTDAGGPAAFDLGAAYTDPRDAADAFIAVVAAQTGARYETEVLAEDTDRQSILVTETGLADDSVAGLQYVLAVERRGAEWGVAEVSSRALCLRGVSEGDVCT